MARVTVTLSYDIKFDENFPSLEEMLEYFRGMKFSPQTVEELVASDLIGNMTDEFTGVAEYGSVSISDIRVEQ